VEQVPSYKPAQADERGLFVIEIVDDLEDRCQLGRRHSSVLELEREQLVDRDAERGRSIPPA
jgi:hypothetical protein